MAKHIIHTRNSQYLVDTDNKTWERIAETELSGRLRTIKGTYKAVSFGLGFPLELQCPPIEGTSAVARWLVTTPVIKVETAPCEALR